MNKETLRNGLADHFIVLIARAWECTCGKRFGFSDTAIDHQTEEIWKAMNSEPSNT